MRPLFVILIALTAIAIGFGVGYAVREKKYKTALKEAAPGQTLATVSDSKAAA